MWKEIFAHSTVLELPLIAMALFMTTFTVAVWRALSKKQSDHQERLARLPLFDDEGARRD